jgi:hypothetical protein
MTEPCLLRRSAISFPQERSEPAAWHSRAADPALRFASGLAADAPPVRPATLVGDLITPSALRSQDEGSTNSPIRSAERHYKR